MFKNKTYINFSKAKRAAKCYLTLLDIGFTRETALKLVSLKYGLTKSELMILYRCVHPTIESYSRLRKLVDPSEVRDKVFTVDGFNVMITIQSVIEDIPVCISSDGLLRDIMKSYRKFSYRPEIHNRIMEVMLKYIKELKPKESIIVYDKQISYSGMIAAQTNEIIKRLAIKGSALVKERADKAIIELGEVVASSDVVIANKARRIFDLAYYIILKEDLILKPNIHVLKII